MTVKWCASRVSFMFTRKCLTNDFSLEDVKYNIFLGMHAPRSIQWTCFLSIITYMTCCPPDNLHTQCSEFLSDFTKYTFSSNTMDFVCIWYLQISMGDWYSWISIVFDIQILCCTWPSLSGFCLGDSASLLLRRRLSLGMIHRIKSRGIKTCVQRDFTLLLIIDCTHRYKFSN